MFSPLKSFHSFSLQVEVRVWAMRSAIDQVDFALDQGVTILEYFEQFFDERFPLPKQGAHQSIPVFMIDSLTRNEYMRCYDICV